MCDDVRLFCCFFRGGFILSVYLRESGGFNAGGQGVGNASVTSIPTVSKRTRPFFFRSLFDKFLFACHYICKFSMIKSFLPSFTSGSGSFPATFSVSSFFFLFSFFFFFGHASTQSNPIPSNPALIHFHFRIRFFCDLRESSKLS